MNNKFNLTIDAKLKNEGLIRDFIAAFLVPLDPTIDELSDIKTAISEVVTNCIVHGYDGREDGSIYITCSIDGTNLTISVADDGVGIKDIEKAKQPFFTTKPDAERSGMGFTIMETFMDSLDVQNRPEGGLIVTLSKNLNLNNQDGYQK